MDTASNIFFRPLVFRSFNNTSTVFMMQTIPCNHMLRIFVVALRPKLDFVSAPITISKVDFHDHLYGCCIVHIPPGWIPNFLTNSFTRMHNTYVIYVGIYIIVEVNNTTCG